MKAEIQQVEKELEGLSVIDDKILRCDNCKRDLVNIVVVKPSSVQSTFQAECVCGEKTFKKTLQGRVIIGACDGVELADYVVEDDLTLIKVAKL